MAIAAELPVAQVVIDSPLPHLDRVFDYAVPGDLVEAAQPGVRVRVRFAGRLINGWIIGRTDKSEHKGQLAPLHAVVSREVVLTEELLELCREVAHRQAGVLSDVLRAAIPPRHAGAEAVSYPMQDKPAKPPIGPWADYVAGPALLSHIGNGQLPRALVAMRKPAELLAILAAQAAAVGRGAIIVAPQRSAVDQVVEHLAKLGVSNPAVLTSDQGPQRRYAAWLRAHRGASKVVVGTRSAVFASVPDLAIIGIWDDWDELHTDPQAPYWNTRDVAILRSRKSGLVIGGAAVSAEAVALGEWLTHMRPQNNEAPIVRSTGPQAIGRVSAEVLAAIRRGLARGPVLVSVARPGYLPGLACASCRLPAKCAGCGGSITVQANSAMCTLCGTRGWTCSCGSAKLRATAVGSERTAEELGRAFPGVPVRTSSGERLVSKVDGRPSIVVATPSAEPMAVGGYASAVLLDGNTMLARPSLRAAETVHGHWANITTLVRSRADGGEVLVVADAAAPAVQGLVRTDPIGFAERELQTRYEVGLPPAVRAARLSGALGDLEELTNGVSARRLGPIQDGEIYRLVLTVPRERGVALAEELAAAVRIRSAKRSGEVVRVVMDPVEVG